MELNVIVTTSINAVGDSCEDFEAQGESSDGKSRVDYRGHPLRAQCDVMPGFYYYLTGGNFTFEFMSQ